jgi:hypothetical protein
LEIPQAKYFAGMAPLITSMRKYQSSVWVLSVGTKRDRFEIESALTPFAKLNSLFLVPALFVSAKEAFQLLIFSVAFPIGMTREKQKT